MLKLIGIDQTFFQDEPSIRLLDDFKISGLVKKAETDDRISTFAKNIQPDPGKIYVHILALGAGEFYGANKNADFFPAETLKNYYETFVTSPAYIYRHHVNRDPTIAMGKVIYAIYNDRMARVELIAWIDRVKGKDIVGRIERGDFPSTSMATHTPYDVCSICGNQAHSRAAYCKHLATELGRIYPDGRKVMAINSAPLRFFDLSAVIRPADVTSSVLQKLASEQNKSILGSAEAAEIEGLQEKSANHKKLSELIKEVEGEITGSADSVNALLDKIKDPDDEVLGFLAHYNIDDVIHAFAELGVSPSISFFAKLIGQKMSGEHIGIEHLVCGMMRAEPGEVMVDTDTSSLYKSASAHPRAQILTTLIPFAKQASLYPGMVMQRAFDIGDYSSPAQGPTGLIGYAGQGPVSSPDPADTYRALKASLKDEKSGMLKTLATIAGMAIAAKWLLSKLIDAKMQEVLARQAKAETDQYSSAKISIIKSAQEAITTQKLVKQDLLRSLKI